MPLSYLVRRVPTLALYWGRSDLVCDFSHKTSGVDAVGTLLERTLLSCTTFVTGLGVPPAPQRGGAAVRHWKFIGYNDLPAITSAITIESNGSTITRGPAVPDFRILAVGSSGNLTSNRHGHPRVRGVESLG